MGGAELHPAALRARRVRVLLTARSLSPPVESRREEDWPHEPHVAEGPATQVPSLQQHPTTVRPTNPSRAARWFRGPLVRGPAACLSDGALMVPPLGAAEAPSRPWPPPAPRVPWHPSCFGNAYPTPPSHVLPPACFSSTAGITMNRPRVLIYLGKDFCLLCSLPVPPLPPAMPGTQMPINISGMNE